MSAGAAKTPVAVRMRATNKDENIIVDREVMMNEEKGTKKNWVSGMRIGGLQGPSFYL